MSDPTTATIEQRVAALEAETEQLRELTGALVSLMAYDVAAGALDLTDEAKDTPARAFVRLFARHASNMQTVAVLRHVRAAVIGDAGQEGTPHMALLGGVLDKVIARREAQLKKDDAAVLKAAADAGLPTEPEPT